MEALVKTQKGDGFLEIRDVQDPVVGDNDVLIRIKYAGICGTDLHIKKGGFIYIPPVVIGHEFSGEIVEVGKNVRNHHIGDRVVSEAHKGGCGICQYCLTGQVEVCREKKAIGYKIDGCFAPYIAMPVTSLHRMPDNVSYEHAALTEPVAIIAKALFEKNKIEAGEFVIVLGSGPIGLLAAAAAKAAGARAVMITGLDGDEQLRFKAARKMQIDYIVNVQKEDVVAQVRDLTGGVGADLVIDATGKEAATRQAFELVRINGRIAGLGFTNKETIAFPWETGLFKSVQLRWSFSSSWTSWERALTFLASGKIDVAPLITQTFPLTEWEKAFDLLENLEGIKVLLTP